jgi:hypothetical protein
LLGPSAVNRQQTAKTLISRGLSPGGDKIVPRRQISSQPHFLSPKRKRVETSAKFVLGADPCVRPWFRVSCRGDPLGRPVGVGWALPTISSAPKGSELLGFVQFPLGQRTQVCAPNEMVGGRGGFETRPSRCRVGTAHHFLKVAQASSL